MVPKILKDLYKRTIRLRKYNNVIEAAHWAIMLRKFSGTCVFELKSLPGNRVAAKFSIIGFVFFVLWGSLYLYCTYKTHYEDLSVLRMLYDTKLKRYGDDFERASSLLFVLLVMSLTTFKLSCNRSVTQHLVDIDFTIEKAGSLLDYYKLARRAVYISFGQVIVYVVRIACINIALSSSIVMPLEKMYQVVFSDSLAILTTSLYCYHLIIVRDRFKWINKTLCDIKNRNSWEYKVFIRGKVPANMIKVVELQDRHVCQKIKTCARVYSMLFDSCQAISRLYGLVLLFTMLFYFNYIILYLFYFMEATASGLFHDLSRYFDFLVYTFWEIVIALGIIFLVIYFSETTVESAKKTAYLTHELINEDFSSTINNEAIQLSIQLLHEVPVFTVCGLFELNYAFLEQGARSVFTYLVILLQFVTENSSSKM